MNFAADFAPFFTDFGVSALVGGVSVTGIHENITADAFGMVPDSIPTFTCPAADVSTLSVGASLSISANSFIVSGIDYDGTGMAIIRLKTRAPNGFDVGFSSGFGL